MKRLAIFAVLFSLLPACGGEEPKKPDAKEVKAEKKPKKAAEKKKPKPKKKAPTAAALAPEEPRTRAKDIPTYEDYEDEASRTVAVENLEAELDRLEAEIVGIPN
jgi:hypothetical protein